MRSRVLLLLACLLVAPVARADIFDEFPGSIRPPGATVTIYFGESLKSLTKKCPEVRKTKGDFYHCPLGVAGFELTVTPKRGVTRISFDVDDATFVAMRNRILEIFGTKARFELDGREGFGFCPFNERGREEGCYYLLAPDEGEPAYFTLKKT